MGKGALRGVTLAGFLIGQSVLAGCGAAPVDLREGPREYVASDYRSVLRKWTRSEQLNTLEAMDNVLTVSSTYESWDFRWAYAVRYADDYRLSIDERKRLLDRTLEETHDSFHFYVALYAQEWKWGDLTLDEPAWVVRLVDDQGNETPPAAVQAIKRPGAIERTYYPYTSPWRAAYRITFPKATAAKPSIRAGAQWFGLRFAGPQGNTTLVWEVERD